MSQSDINRTLERSKREMEVITTFPRIIQIVRKYLVEKRMFLKNMDFPGEVTIKSISDEGEIHIRSEGQQFHKDEKVSLFRILGRYMELNCLVYAYKADNSYLFHLQTAGIAKKERSAFRIQAQDNSVYVRNIHTSKSSINADLFTIPTSVKVNFAAYEQRLKSEYDFLKIDVYPRRDPFFDAFRKAGGSLLVSDTQDQNSYRPTLPDFFDYRQYLADDLHRKILEYRQAKIVSEIIAPVLYLSHDLTCIPLGYLQARSREKYFQIEDVLQLQGYAFEMVDRIRDSNTIVIKEPQTVLDFSRGGLKVRIDSAELINYLIRQKGFTFDLFFKGQAPITFYGLIRSTFRSSDGSMTLGIQLSGNSAREGEMKRYQDNVLSQEKIVRQKQENKRKKSGR